MRCVHIAARWILIARKVWFGESDFSQRQPVWDIHDICRLSGSRFTSLMRSSSPPDIPYVNSHIGLNVLFISVTSFIVLSRYFCMCLFSAKAILTAFWSYWSLIWHDLCGSISRVFCYLRTSSCRIFIIIIIVIFISDSISRNWGIFIWWQTHSNRIWSSSRGKGKKKKLNQEAIKKER